MRNSQLSVILLFVLSLISWAESYTSEERTDSSQSIYGAASAILGGTANTHTQHRNTYPDNPFPSQGAYGNTPGNYFNGPPTGIYYNGPPTVNHYNGPPPRHYHNGPPPGNFYNGPPPGHYHNGPYPPSLGLLPPVNGPLPQPNGPCTSGTNCPLPPPRGPCTTDGSCNFQPNRNIGPSSELDLQDIDKPNAGVDIENPIVNGAGQLDVRYGAPSNNPSQNYPRPPNPQTHPLPTPSNYYPPNQVDIRYPPPSQSNPPQGYGPPSQNQWPYPQPSSNVGHVHTPDCGHHHHQSGYNSLNHSLKINTEYNEDGRHQLTYTGTNGFPGYGPGGGFGSNYNGAFNRPGF